MNALLKIAGYLVGVAGFLALLLGEDLVLVANDIFKSINQEKYDG